MDRISSEKDEGDEEDENNSTEEGDVQGDYFDELDIVNETLDPNQDIKVVKNEYSIHDGDENYLDNSDVESLKEEILEDGRTKMTRTRAKFPRYDKNCKMLSFLLGLSFTDHVQFKKALLKYAVQEKIDYTFVKNARYRAQLKKRLDKIENIQDGSKQTLENKAIQQWCRAYFKTHLKCDSIENNSTEAWNFMLIAARSKPIISLNKDLRDYLMERKIKMLNFAQK
nr:elongation factor G, III-V domain-containing protein [Tanacetum cinerariifolium]